MEAASVAYCDRLTAGDADGGGGAVHRRRTVDTRWAGRYSVARDEIHAFYKGADRSGPAPRRD